LIALVIHASYLSEDESLKLKEASEICMKCGVCCVVRAYFCHVQYDKQFDAKNTYVYNCLGAEEPTKNPNLWMCVSCHKCEELCPYEVSPVKFIEAIKAQALKQGHVHPVIKGEMENIMTSGYAFPLTGSSKRQREQLGLEPLGNEAVEDLRLIAIKTGLSKRIQSTKEA
jgi:heterodisulfide reductase subunit C